MQLYFIRLDIKPFSQVLNSSFLSALTSSFYQGKLKNNKTVLNLVHKRFMSTLVSSSFQASVFYWVYFV